VSECDWTHDGLQQDLAETRKQMHEIVAENLPLGVGGGLADIFAMKPSWTNPNPVVYEVKVTRADFQRDVQAGKFTKYLPHCRRLYFAVPRGLLKKDDVPEGMGLTVRGENGWHVTKAPHILKGEMANPYSVVFAILLRVYPNGLWRKPTRVERIRGLLEAEDICEAHKVLPEKFRSMAMQINAARREVRDAKTSICRELGINPEEEDRELYSLVREVLNRAPKELPAIPQDVVWGVNNIKSGLFRIEKAIKEQEAP